jgi:hypothetical protein
VLVQEAHLVGGKAAGEHATSAWPAMRRRRPPTATPARELWAGTCRAAASLAAGRSMRPVRCSGGAPPGSSLPISDSMSRPTMPRSTSPYISLRTTSTAG